MTDENTAGRTFMVEVNEGGGDVRELLQQATGLAGEVIADAIEKGALWQAIKGKPKRLRNSAAKAVAGSRLYLHYNPAVLSEVPQSAGLILDLGDYSVWYKPFGMRSQGSRWGDHCTLYRWAETHLQPPRPAILVHRLDRAATGLMLLAHDRKVAAQLAAMFEQRAMDKRYQAIVHGKFPGNPPERRIENLLDGREAVSHVRRLTFDPVSKRSLLEVRIETGRKHQIRRHLSSLGFPVVGDRLYGREGDGEDLLLSAVSLSFSCPVSGRRRNFELPERLKLTMKNVGD